MKLKSGFITRTIGDEQIMVSAGKEQFSGIVRSNETAAFIVDLLKQETDLEAILGKLMDCYEVSEEIAIQDVDYVLGQLRKIGALEE